jgi:8-oxo-dGTP pyrophosphatase MutT (NUDIX family)
MYFTPRMLQKVADRYGYPPIIAMDAPVDEEEYNFIRSTQYHGRCHDITLYIFRGNKIIVNAKHHYPKGLFRAPSGGLKPGESFEEGTLREAKEETGVNIQLLRYILQVNVSFSCGRKSIPWRTHVFTAEYKSGKIAPTDHREIREARLVELAAFDEYKKIIGRMESGGLAYRARLHDEVIKLL